MEMYDSTCRELHTLMDIVLFHYISPFIKSQVNKFANPFKYLSIAGSR